MNWMTTRIFIGAFSHYQSLAECTPLASQKRVMNINYQCKNITTTTAANNNNNNIIIII